jgi:hypothetical protein
MQSNLHWFGFWVFLSTLVAVDAYVYLEQRQPTCEVSP